MWKHGHRTRTDCRPLFWLPLLAVLSACTAAPEKESASYQVTRTDFENLSGWSNDDHLAAFKAFKTGCPALIKRGARKTPPAFSIGLKTIDWSGVCRDALGHVISDRNSARRFFERTMAPWAISAGTNSGLFTGYYEADLQASERRGTRYRHPIYARPADLITVRPADFDKKRPPGRLSGRVQGNRLVPYYTRSQIETGVLRGKADILLWADDPVDLFFLHIQGSGRVRLPDGTTRRLGFAATNGQPYTAIGRVLIKDGHVPREKISMQSIRRWLANHPAQAQAVMNRNKRYVFFRELRGPGPIGSLGVPLSAGRSLAIDASLVPLGAPVWVSTKDPIKTRQPWRRLMMAQDTGAAIKGPVRGDIFFGYGKQAARHAGAMNQRGTMFVLLPRAIGAGS